MKKQVIICIHLTKLLCSQIFDNFKNNDFKNNVYI